MQAELVALRVLQHHREVIEPFLLEHTNAGDARLTLGKVMSPLRDRLDGTYFPIRQRR
jgi:hypothetical protein